jgi:ankyrin repeat protein
LLSNKAEVDAPGAIVDGMTALIGAAAHGRIDTVSIFLQAGAGRRSNDVAQFEEAIQMSNENGHYPTADSLKAYHCSSGAQSVLEMYDFINLGE